MDSVIEQSFRINLLVMKALWMYPQPQSTRLFRVKAYTRYFLLTIPVPLLGILYFFLEDNIDLNRMGNDVFIMAELVCYFLKLLPFITNGEQIKRAIHYLEAPLFTGFNDKQMKIVAESVRICQRNSRIYLISIVGGSAVWALKPLFGQNYELPVDLWLPFDALAEAKIFYVVYLLTIIGVVYPAFCTSVIDPLIGGLACLTIGQLKVLKDNLQHLSKYADEEIINEATLKSKIMYGQIGKCVDHHNAILDFVKVYEDSFSMVLFSQFMGVIVRICICCLQLRMFEPFSFNFLSILSYVGIMLIPIYFYCYYGTALYEESNTITNTIYSGNWYDYDLKSRKALVTLMERAKLPVIVTPGKILDLSLVTFTMILRRTYSLMAVLNNY